MALNPSAVVGVAALLLLAGCPNPTNIGDLAPQAGGNETTGELPPTSGAEASGTGAADSELPTSGSGSPATTTSGTFGTSLDPESSDVGDGAGPPPLMSVYAIRSGDIPEVGGSGTSQSSSGSGGTSGGVDDDALYVAVGLFTGTCANPYGDGACDAWSVSFTLDLDQQQPGTYDLAVINGGFYEGDPFDGMDCARGNGSLEGSVVITSIDDLEIQGELQVSEFAPMGTDLTSFSFTADRC